MAEQDDTTPEVENAEQTAEEQAEQQVEQAAEADTAEPQAEVSEAEQIEKLVAEVADGKDQVLRAQAEVQNAKRRASQDVEKAHKFAVDKFGQDLLPVVDSLEMAITNLNVEDEGHKPVHEGLELTLKMFVDVLAKNGVEQINPENEPFDPQLHQAVTMVENDKVEPNTVISVMQKGYTLNGRVVRPAMVMVSKGG